MRIGEIFREKVDSQLGYEDWVFTGISIKEASGRVLYAMKSERGVYWFFEEEIKEMKSNGLDQSIF